MNLKAAVVASVWKPNMLDLSNPDRVTLATIRGRGIRDDLCQILIEHGAKIEQFCQAIRDS
jgi:hypothetical protein